VLPPQQQHDHSQAKQQENSAVYDAAVSVSGTSFRSSMQAGNAYADEYAEVEDGELAQ
jgi:hypothetical protein